MVGIPPTSRGGGVSHPTPGKANTTLGVSFMWVHYPISFVIVNVNVIFCYSKTCIYNMYSNVLKHICTGHFKHHYGGSFTNYDL